MFEDSAVAASAYDRQSIDGFVRSKFPDQSRLDDLLNQQKEEQGYLAFIERNGATGRVVEFLRGMVDARALEIDALRANGKFPAPRG
jgi:hypothetical protein